MRTRAILASLVAGATIALGACGGGSSAPPACPSGVSSQGGQVCSQELPPPPGALKQAAPTPQVGANGRLSASDLSPATGCANGLANSAAAAWNHVAVIVHEHTGYWLQSNGSASCYRTYAQQVELRNYWCGQGACGNAAVPGTSNHGWGLAVDAPPATVSYIHQYASGLFGQGYGSCSDAPWESWHVKYCGGYSGPDPGPYGSGGGGHQHHFNTLARGDRGQRVKELDTHLAILKRPTPKHPTYIHWKNVNAKYDKQTAYGVRRLQRDCHLKDDGIYGAHTHKCEVHRWHAHKASK